MKIAITANTSWYIYNFRRNTILSLINLGHEIVAVSSDSDYKEKLESLGCKFKQIKMQRWGKNPFYDLKTIYEFFRVFKNEKVSLTLNFTPKNNIYATFAASILKAKVINNIAGLGVVFIEKSIFSKLVSFLYKTSQKKADYIFFQNEEDKKLFVDLGIVTPENSDRLPGSGVDLSRFEYSEIGTSQNVRFLLVARLIAEKGIRLYAEAAKELNSRYPNLEFCLLGPLDTCSTSAITKKELETWQSENVINYLGFTDHVEDELKKSDCVVLPSYYREGVPKSLLEAAAIGRPIITTDNVGCREVVDDGLNGFLCEPRSLISLVNSLEKFILLSPTEKVNMSIMSREKVQKEFDERIVIEKYLKVIDDLSKSS
ncbi:glycosyltransferase family 4 protein [Enterobacter huaxiensis]|uniref:Glycosyltransferase family 4 protein n=1 Tax=Enterobacter huaxiensis TaxID=2494702 RepID=A0ABU6EQS3_9ENTR|nr:glycosyltransferase family 4 protein [Enterobacter huaxiensis]MEB7543267.1 glycosyltransferase family 4 protein [Enterobacter huaxiensis]MEB7579703.1 glycosyltransferase family 4 protein [Enterobacter huaxiensis]MEB7662099.1 glycosyltransferase family 4 protein [Enterobacter huaxiensis]